MDIKFYYENTELTLQGIADKLGTTYKKVFSFVKKNYSKEYRKSRKVINYSKSKSGNVNPMKGKYGRKHHNYIGVVSDNKGYLMVLKPGWYTGRKGSKHIFQHHAIICEHLKITCVPPGWVVHHCNKNPLDNRVENLVLMTAGDHVKLHKLLEGATTISKESTLKWVEAHGTLFKSDDIV